MPEQQPGEALAALVCSAPASPHLLASHREDAEARIDNVKQCPTQEDQPAILNTSTGMLHTGTEVIAAFVDRGAGAGSAGTVPVASAEAPAAGSAKARRRKARARSRSSSVEPEPPPTAPRPDRSRSGKEAIEEAARDVAKESTESAAVPDSKVLNSTWTQPATSKSCYDRWMHKLDQGDYSGCLLYTSPSPRDGLLSRMPSSA